MRSSGAKAMNFINSSNSLQPKNVSKMSPIVKQRRENPPKTAPNHPMNIPAKIYLRMFVKKEKKSKQTSRFKLEISKE
jgi:hypothetical protein